MSIEAILENYINNPKWKGKIFMEDEKICYKDGFNHGVYSCSGRIERLKKENEQLKAQIEEMKCCFNCDRPIKHHDCGDWHNGSNWKLAESDRLIRS